jgi:hypothetical protein
VLCLSAAFAQKDNDGDGGSRDNREIKISVSNNAVTLESKTQSGKDKSFFSVGYAVNDARLEIDLRSKVDEGDTKDKARFKWKIGRVVEYLDNGTPAGFQEGDTIGASWDFKNKNFQFSDITTDQTIKTFQGVSQDGFFKLVGYISGGPFTTKEGNKTVLPVAHKFDITISPAANWWTQNGSRVAVLGWVMSAESTQTKEMDTDGNDVTAVTTKGKRIHFGAAASPAAFFNWDLNPNCTNAAGGLAPCPVIVSPLTADPSEDTSSGDKQAGNSNKKTSHAFDLVHPRRIFWDPMIGIGAGTHVVPSMLALALLVLAALLSNLA